MKEYLRVIENAIKSEESGKINIYFSDGAFINVSRFEAIGDNIVFYNDDIMIGLIPDTDYITKQFPGQSAVGIKRA
ncbi:MAG: hypothetical protein ABRQ25_13470 [Clostridiaceae bacterium]